jgi:hypothetical protein
MPAGRTCRTSFIVPNQVVEQLPAKISHITAKPLAVARPLAWLPRLAAPDLCQYGQHGTSSRKGDICSDAEVVHEVVRNDAAENRGQVGNDGKGSGNRRAATVMLKVDIVRG